MTTSNRITAKVLTEMTFVPLESLHTQHDSITYVFKKEGIRTLKQEVVVGETNSNEAIILSGLTADDQVFLSLPYGRQDQEVVLLPQQNGKRSKKKEVEKEAKGDTVKVSIQ